MYQHKTYTSFKSYFKIIYVLKRTLIVLSFLGVPRRVPIYVSLIVPAPTPIMSQNFRSSYQNMSLKHILGHYLVFETKSLQGKRNWDKCLFSFPFLLKKQASADTTCHSTQVSGSGHTKTGQVKFSKMFSQSSDSGLRKKKTPKSV